MFLRVSYFGFVLLAVVTVIGVCFPLWVVTPVHQVLTTKLTFASLGLLFGSLQVFIGVLLSLIGVTMDYDLDATLGAARVKLASASPGILLIIVGNAVFAFSLVRQFEVSEVHEKQYKPHFLQQDTTEKPLQVTPIPQAKGKGPE